MIWPLIEIFVVAFDSNAIYWNRIQTQNKYKQCLLQSLFYSFATFQILKFWNFIFFIFFKCLKEVSIDTYHWFILTGKAIKIAPKGFLLHYLCMERKKTIWKSPLFLPTLSARARPWQRCAHLRLVWAHAVLGFSSNEFILMCLSPGHNTMVKSKGSTLVRLFNFLKKSSITILLKSSIKEYII